MLDGARDDNFWKHHLNIVAENPTDGLVEQGETDYKVVVGCYNELIKAVQAEEDLQLTIYQIIDIFHMMAIVMTPKISVSAIKDHNVIKISLAAIDTTEKRMIESFVMSMQNERRIWLTSATICSYDYGQLFMGAVQPERVSFGANGDPLNNNSKMLILADSRKYSAIGDRSRFNCLDEIVSRIVNILTCYGLDDCLIIALNKTEAKAITKELKNRGIDKLVTYYKESTMTGTNKKERVMIAVGIANKPSNSYDSVTKNAQESKMLLHESMHSDTWQNWSRVKESHGINPSLVFGLGCTIEECNAVITWGYDRVVEIEPYDQGQKKVVNVTCSKQITKPRVVKFYSEEEMFTLAAMHKKPIKNYGTLNNCLKNPEKKSKNSLINNNIRENISLFQETLQSERDLINLILNRKDAYAVQNPTGGYSCIKTAVNDKMIESHLEGTQTLGAYQFDNENKVCWLCADIDSHPIKGKEETEEDIQKRDDLAEENVEKLCNLLSYLGVPYLKEASGSPHSYHVFIFVKPVSGEIAKAFMDDIKKE